MSSQVPGAAQPTRNWIPWWGVALPAIAFAALLTLLATPSHADSPATAPATGLAGWIAEALPAVIGHFL